MLENKSNVVELDQQLIGRLSRMDSIMDQKMSIAKLETKDTPETVRKSFK